MKTKEALGIGIKGQPHPDRAEDNGALVVQHFLAPPLHPTSKLSVTTRVWESLNLSGVQTNQIGVNTNPTGEKSLNLTGVQTNQVGVNTNPTGVKTIQSDRC